MERLVGPERRECGRRGPLAVVAAVVATNLVALVGIVNTSPLGPLGMTETGRAHGFIHGQWYTDPNAGWTAQALGRLAAIDWLHGVVPWWNPYEGLGAPLAAGMQSAAFFPPTLLLALSEGQLYFHVVLEVAAGLGTYLLVRELGLRRGVATVGGVIFGLCGTFSWFWHAAANPVPFLPLMVYGIERLARRDRFDHLGWLVLALGLMLSVYAGFPETAYLDGILVGLWAIFRLCSGAAIGRLFFAGGVVLGVVTGALLSAPLALPFAKYLPIADSGKNAGGIVLRSFGSQNVPVLGLPYLYGPIAAFIKEAPASGGFWAISGGYVTCSAVALAVVGLVGGRSQRRLRIFLAGVAVVFSCWQLNLPVLSRILDTLDPLSHDVNVSRYLSPTWELAVALLACFGIDAIAHRADHLRAGVVAGLVAGLGLIGLDLGLARRTVSQLWQTSSYHRYAIAMLAWAAAIVVAVSVVGLVRAHFVASHASARRGSSKLSKPPSSLARHAGAVVGCLVALDAIVMCGLPLLSAPVASREHVDTAPATYLESHLGDGRFYGVWIYHPDYGSYFQIASIEANDVPVPKAYATFVRKYLGSNTNPLKFDGLRVLDPHGPNAVSQLDANLANYEAVDVRYLLAYAGSHPFGEMRGGVAAGGERIVWKDRHVEIFSIPHARAFFSLAPGETGDCTLASSGIDRVQATCSRPAILDRAELDLPGWSATIDGRSSPVQKTSSGLTSLLLPAGRDTVELSYTPPGAGLGLDLFGAGAIVAAGLPLAAWYRRRSRRATRHRSPPRDLTNATGAEPAASSV